ncbi:MAG: VOC family protein [Armatimonadota bacterium]|nr:VOC family protein [Armatimonadota bacterium]MDR7452527.1 VOC family protein [Armatimonadota bacterium]MDR7467754.1 VOC family protein [Armatimonadota bacterium]MDR7494954.1 VOC family protein [Armatimonadota bacterium]MDR7499781.1 VOC family protein [Armatimonadota bacterium]
MTLSTIGQIAVHVNDLERAVQFYRDRLGMRFLFQAPPGLAFFDAGGVRLMLSRPEGRSGGTSILYFKVDDIQATAATLRSRDVRFTDEPHVIARMDTYDLWMAFFQDSEGNTHALMAEVPRA